MFYIQSSLTLLANGIKSREHSAVAYKVPLIRNTWAGHDKISGKRLQMKIDFYFVLVEDVD